MQENEVGVVVAVATTTDQTTRSSRQKFIIEFKVLEAPEMDGRLESLEFIKELFMVLVSLT
jgi:hypothetical protein